jgi:DNA polymerase alpha subunit A
MIHAPSKNIQEIYKFGSDLKQQVNKKYKCLEIELDGIYSTMLLLKKKKYAAVVVKNGKSTIETKGIDLVRREWCKLSKEVSQYVLEQILSDNDEEASVANVISFMTKVGNDMRNGVIPLEKLIITKSLSKHPEQYNDASIQPHVQVALRMKANGKSARIGEHIGYIICEGSESLAQRARSPNEEGITPDVDYYLSNQILPPVLRLCEPVSELDPSLLAESLKLDGSKYNKVEQEKRYVKEEQEKDKFENCEKLELECCVFYSPEASLACPVCDQIPKTMKLRLLKSIRKFVLKYYESWYICSEGDCQARTRNISVLSSQCTRDDCSGKMVNEYSDTSLYNQLLYFKSLGGSVSNIIDQYFISNSARGFISLQNIFPC